LGIWNIRARIEKKIRLKNNNYKLKEGMGKLKSMQEETRIVTEKR